MSANKALMTNFKLTEDVTAAVVEAIKAGMDKIEVAALLSRLAEMIENSDD